MKQIRMRKTGKRGRSVRKSVIAREPAGEYRLGGDGQKQYDLEEHTFQFAADVRALLKRLPRTIANIEDAKQLARPSGSVGANYIEANESLGKKDFLLHIKISRKEAKESRFFLRLLDIGTEGGMAMDRTALVQESTELMNIFAAIFRKSR